MTNKYTKNEHMHHLNDGAEPMDTKAKHLIAERMAITTKKKPQNIGQWLQVTHREVFNSDFELYVAAHSKVKHCMS